MRLRAMGVVAIVCTMGLPVRSALAQSFPCSYSVRVLPEVDCGLFSGPGNPRAINNLGHVLLTADCAQYDRTYLWTGGDTLTLLPLPPGALGFTGTDMNDLGQIVGAAVTTFSGRRAYVYDLNSGAWTELPPLNPPAGWSGANAITNDGRVCGFRSIGSKGDPVNPFQAFVWSPADGFTDLGVMTGPNSEARDVSESGDVVGWTGANLPSLGVRAFTYVDGQTTILSPPPGCVSSAAFAINEDGVAVVRGHLSAFPNFLRGFTYADGTFTPVGILPGFDITLAADIGDNGIVTGTLRRLSPSLNHGFVWRNGALADLNDLVEPSGSFVIRSVSNINRAGRIIGSAGLPIEDATIVLTPVVRLGDVSADCQVNIDDLLTVIQWWGPGTSPGDANGDGIVDLTDLLLVLNNWTFN